MTRFNIFDDDRKIPKVFINIKVKVKTNSQEESISWNNAFGYIMKKPRTKLEFLSVDSIRSLDLSKITLSSLEDFISEEDMKVLSTIEDIFDNRLTDDIKAFILAILKVSYNNILTIINRE